MKHLKFILTLLMAFAGQNVFSSAENIIINDQQCIFSGPKGSVSYTCDDKVSNIAFSISGKKISAGNYSGDNLFEKGTDIYNNIHSQMSTLARMISKKRLEFSCGGDNRNSAAYLESGEDMLVSSGTILLLDNTIALCNQDALFSAPLIKTNNFFVSAKGSVTFKAPENACSWLESLTFVASAGTRPFQFMCLGDLNFNPPQATLFVVIGAKEIIFNFKNV